MEAPRKNEGYDELASELTELGFDAEQLNSADVNLFLKHKNGELTEGDLMGHKSVLGDNFSPTPDQLKLLEYLSDNL